MTLGFTGLVPTSFWAQWTVFEYEKKNGKFISDKFAAPSGKHKVQFAPVFVGDGDFTKMFGWGMEILVFTTYRATLKPWYRYIELCKGGEKTMILFGVPAYKFQIYLEIRFVIATTVRFRKKQKGGKRHMGQRLPFWSSLRQ